MIQLVSAKHADRLERRIRTAETHLGTIVVGFTTTLPMNEQQDIVRSQEEHAVHLLTIVRSSI